MPRRGRVGPHVRTVTWAAFDVDTGRQLRDTRQRSAVECFHMADLAYMARPESDFRVVDSLGNVTPRSRAERIDSIVRELVA